MLKMFIEEVKIMNVLNGIQNFLEFINNNWTGITVVIGLCVAIGKKAKNYFNKSDEEKINIAKNQIHEMILKLVTDAEEDYEQWNKAGSIKRSKVIGEIFTCYPILSKVVDQDALIKWIDSEIDNALIVLRKVIEENK